MLTRMRLEKAQGQQCLSLLSTIVCQGVSTNLRQNIGACSTLNWLHAVQIQGAVVATIAEGKYRTGDLGGTSTCSDFTKAIIDKL